LTTTTTNNNPLQTSLDTFILDPRNQPLLALVKALRNGAVYGTKVRFPHALVYVPPPSPSSLSCIRPQSIPTTTTTTTTTHRH
jgi:hypothetical protein